MENRDNNFEAEVSKNVNKKIVIKELAVGLLYSFLGFIFSSCISLASFLPLLTIIGLGGSSPLNDVEEKWVSLDLPIAIIFISCIVFIIFNTILFLRSKERSKKTGFLAGYLFVVIYILCALIITQSYEKNIKDQQVSHMALQSNNETLCAGAYRDACLQQIAEQKNEPSICEKISDINSQKKNDCYIFIAIALKNPTICEKIDNETYASACTLASFSNVESCMELEDQDLKSDCFYHFALRNTDPLLCEKMYFNNVDKLHREQDSCYWDAILKSNSVDLYKKYCPILLSYPQYPSYDFYKTQCNNFLNSHQE